MTGKWESRSRWSLAGCSAAIAIMLIAGIWASPSATSVSMSALDRVFFWSFVVFSVGLAELFVLLVCLTIWGRLDLTQVFRDKEGGGQRGGGGLDSLTQNTVSLSRLQAFLWTLVVLTVFFHAAARHPGEGIPTIPPEILVVMGISGAVYLGGKNLSVQSAINAPGAPTGGGHGAGGSGGSGQPPGGGQGGDQ